MNADRQARSGDGSPGSGKSCRTLMAMPGASWRMRRKSDGSRTADDAVRCADCEAARRARGLEGLGTRDHAAGPRQDLRDGNREFCRARCRDHALRGLEKQRVVQEPAQPAQAMADRRRGQVHPVRRPADVAFVKDDVEEREEVEVRTGKIDFIHHAAEIVSLASASHPVEHSSPEAERRYRCPPHDAPCSPPQEPAFHLNRTSRQRQWQRPKGRRTHGDFRTGQ